MTHGNFFKTLKHCAQKDKVACPFAATAEAISTLIFDAHLYDDKARVTNYAKEIYTALEVLGEYDKESGLHKMGSAQEAAICKILRKQLPNEKRKDTKFREQTAISSENEKFTTLKVFSRL